MTASTAEFSSYGILRGTQLAEVVLKNVVKHFKSVRAVENLSIEIKDKEFAVFVGPSGCGKTTALRMIAGLEEVTSGDIFIDDRKVNDLPPKDRDIAMVFQNYALYPHMNVRENMGFGLRMRKFPKKEIDKRVGEAAEILGIRGLLDRKPKALSGGQRQRVAVGRAIVRKPQVFLFDEPLSNLDAKLRVTMRAEISKLHHRLKATIIYVTHDQVEAMTMADKIYIINEGILQQVGTPFEVYRHPQNVFVAGFIGSPAMNFIDAVVVQENTTSYIDAGGYRLRLPPDFNSSMGAYIGKKVILGIRPEYFSTGMDAAQERNSNRIKAKIEVVEPLGSEVYLYLVSGRHQMVAKLDAEEDQFKVGQIIEFGVDMNKTHLFDAETSQTIV
jgi:multiple sugar transport system ATP-binding protein